MALCEADTAQRGDSVPDDVSTTPAFFTAPVRNYTEIMGVIIDRIRREEVLAQIDTYVQSGVPHQIVTVNVDFLNIAHRDQAFVHLLNAAAVSVPDGMPLVWVSRLIGGALPERITGTDLIYGCAELAARQGYRLFLLGAAPGVADEAAVLLEQRYPGLRIAGTYAPPECEAFGPAENAAIVERIRATHPDMLFVALGTPKQEKWIYQNLQALDVPVCIGVGGVFNFITGRLPRAPEAWQRFGLEWLFRLVLEPRRLWRRYLLDDTRALARVLWHAASHRMPWAAARRAPRVPAQPRLSDRALRSPAVEIPSGEPAAVPVQTLE